MPTRKLTTLWITTAYSPAACMKRSVAASHVRILLCSAVRGAGSCASAKCRQRRNLSASSKCGCQDRCKQTSEIEGIQRNHCLISDKANLAWSRRASIDSGTFFMEGKGHADRGNRTETTSDSNASQPPRLQTVGLVLRFIILSKRSRCTRPVVEDNKT